MYFLYDFLLGLSLFVLLPRVLYCRIVYRQFKHRFSCLLSLSLPEVKAKKGRVFVIYAVSMGETKIAASLFHKLKEDYPSGQFYIVSRSETGHMEAKKSMPEADGHFFLPLDFSWGMKRFLKRLNPDVVMIIESDFWLNFLRISKELGALVFLISGKISSRSFRRFQKVPFFSKKLFSFFDLICAQNDLCQKRFIELGVDPSKVLSTGNLKFDIPFVKINPEPLKKLLGIQSQDKVIVIASTHPREEEEVLRRLRTLLSSNPHLKLIIVPRHPERFSEVEEMLLKSHFPMISYSRIQQKTGNEKIILIDAMGMLLSIYQVADLAVVGGSFFKHLKGHNVFEPIQAGIPVLFGPYMSDQRDLVECILSSQAGIQTSLEELSSQVETLLSDSLRQEVMRNQGEELLLQMSGSFSRACGAVFEKISSFHKETFEI